MTPAILASHPSCQAQAVHLAKELGLPYLEQADASPYFLVVSPEHLALLKNCPKEKPFFIDFTSGALAYRKKQTSLRKEALARAIGIHPDKHPRLADATGGLGRDSFILASLGFRLTVIERSPAIFALLRDGLCRGQQNPELAPIIARIHLVHAEATTWLKENPEYDVIYLDPMFPERRKTASVKKESKILQEIVGFPEDDCKLFEISRNYAALRVVVKRPKSANFLCASNPDFQITGKVCRFDVYLSTSKPPTAILPDLSSQP